MRLVSIRFSFTLLLFITISLWLNCSTDGGVFLFDANMWLLKYAKWGWDGVWFSFGDKSLHQVGHFFAFLAYKIFGLNVVGWSVMLAIFHALNSYFFFSNCNTYLARFSIDNHKKIALIGSFLFLISPYQTEITQWGSTLWYQLCLLWLNILFYEVLRIGQSRFTFRVMLILIVTIISYFTWEFSYVFPIALLLLFYFLDSGVSIKKYLLFVFIPQLLALFGYLYLNRSVNKQLFSHYEGYNFVWSNVVNNVGYYLIKLSNLILFLDYGRREKLQLFFANHVIVLYLIAAVFLLLFIKKIINRQSATLPLYLFIILSAIFILPIVHLNQVFNLRIVQDRYVYLALPFSSMAISFFMMQQKRLVRLFLVVVLSFFSIKLLQSNIDAWKKAYQLQMSLVADYKWQDSPNVYILTSADNVNGAYCLRSQPYSSFAEAYLLFKGKNIFPSVKEVLQYNVTNIKDSFIVTKYSADSIRVAFAQYGNWYWRNGHSAEKNMTTPDFEYAIDEWGMGFTVKLKDSTAKSATIILQQGDKWEAVN